MNGAAPPVGVVALVVPDEHGYRVTCSCGYLVMGWPTLQTAHMDLNNHWARWHADAEDND